MLRLCSIPVAFVIFICYSAASDELRNTCRNETTDYSATITELQEKIVNIFSPTEQQADLLRRAIETTFDKDIRQADSSKPTTQKPANHSSGNVSCDDEYECVLKWECKNETVNQYGNYVVSYRSATSVSACGYMETCCHISDKILPSYNDPMDEDEMAACGTRHFAGVHITLERAPNQEAQFGEFPWMVAILTKTEKALNYIGGGSILAPTIVLTAAHKVRRLVADQLVVRAGEWDMNTEREMYPHIDRNVTQIIIHDSFSISTNTNNIALLILNLSFSSNPHISPICLPSAHENFDYSQCIVNGWGKLATDSSDYQRFLKKISVPIVPRDHCLTKLSNQNIYNLDESYICAGGEKGIDSCYGDGGAPLVCPINGSPNRYYQVGIVAWGVQCGLENVPAVYSNVPYLMPWVSRQLDRLSIDKKYYTFS